MSDLTSNFPSFCTAFSILLPSEIRFSMRSMRLFIASPIFAKTSLDLKEVFSGMVPLFKSLSFISASCRPVVNRSRISFTQVAAYFSSSLSSPSWICSLASVLPFLTSKRRLSSCDLNFPLLSIAFFAFELIVKKDIICLLFSL